MIVPTIISTITGTSIKSFKAVIVVFSLFRGAWLIISSAVSRLVWVTYLTVIFILIRVVCFNKLEKRFLAFRSLHGGSLIFMLTVAIIAGIPPFGVFFIKLFIVINIQFLTGNLTIILMMLLSVRIIYSLFNHFTVRFTIPSIRPILRGGIDREFTYLFSLIFIILSAFPLVVLG